MNVKLYRIKIVLFLTCLLLFTGSNAMAFKISSNAFDNESTIPVKYTCDGDDISPELTWQDPPENTKSFVLIMDDPDAPRGTWVHWVLFNIPVDVNHLKENIDQLPNGTLSGNNSWNRQGYGGPCPPDKMHRYFFKLYALDAKLDLPAGSDKAAVEKAMQGHILGNAELMGKYDRQH